MGVTILSDFTAGKFETITVATGAAVQFNATSIAPTSGPLKNNVAKQAFCTVEVGDIRIRYDGVDPTNTVGHKLSNGQNLTLNDVQNIKNFRAIMDDVTATLNDLAKMYCTYYF